MDIKKILLFNVSLCWGIIFGGIGLINKDKILIFLGLLGLAVFVFLCLKYPGYFKNEKK